MNRVFISLGSNIDSERNLREAVRQLSLRCQLLAVSPVYETAPVGKTDQPNFLNAAALVETGLAATELKTQVLQAIESELGRVHTADKNAPRTIDLDISMFNDEVFDVGPRHIPDPDILRFAHVAVPLADLAPDLCHPETGQALGQIARNLAAMGLARRADIVLWPESRVSNEKGE